MVVVAMVLGLTLAAIVGGYIAVTRQSMKQSQRAFYLNTALNLAESGAEYAVWCLRNTWTLPSDNWSGDSSTRTFLGNPDSPVFTDSQGARGYFNVRVTNAGTSAPLVIAEGVVVPAVGSPLVKQVRVKLSNGGLFSNGMVAKDRLTLNGGALDSYRSSVSDPMTAPIGYEITVATTTLAVGDTSIGAAAAIYGNVAIAQSSTSSGSFISSIQGEIRGPTTAMGQDGVIQKGSNLIDTNRIAYDFTQDLPDVTVPSAGGSTIVNTELPLPNAQDLIIVGDPTGLTINRYQVSSVSIPTGKTLLIVGPVEFVVSGWFTSGGTSSLVVLDGSTTVTTKVGLVTVSKLYTGVGDAKI